MDDGFIEAWRFDKTPHRIGGVLTGVWCLSSRIEIGSGEFREIPEESPFLLSCFGNIESHKQFKMNEATAMTSHSYAPIYDYTDV
jgi:hypothetical protein